MIPTYYPKTSSKAWRHFEDQKPPLLKSTIHVSKYTFRPMDPMSHWRAFEMATLMKGTSTLIPSFSASTHGTVKDAEGVRFSATALFFRGGTGDKKEKCVKKQRSSLRRMRSSGSLQYTICNVQKKYIDFFGDCVISTWFYQPLHIHQ